MTDPAELGKKLYNFMKRTWLAVGETQLAGGGRTSKGRRFLMLMSFFKFKDFCKQAILDSQNPWKMVVRCFQTVFFVPKLPKLCISLFFLFMIPQLW